MTPAHVAAPEDDDLEGAAADELEAAEEALADQATAAATLAELEAEIAILRDLEARALGLKLSGEDAKWRQLIANDAAGEGVNLQRGAHLMVNYDLP